MSNEPSNREKSEIYYAHFRSEVIRLTADRDQLRTQNAALLAENEAFAQERNAFIDFCNTLPHEGRTGCVGPIAVAKWLIAALLADCVVMRGVLEKIKGRRVVMGSTGDYRDGQIDALGECRDICEAALATDHPGAPLIEAVRKAVDLLRDLRRYISQERLDALLDLEKFPP